MLTPVPGATVRHDEDGAEIVVVATCGECGRSWNDAAISDRTPAPSGRCPFEYEHGNRYIVIENTPGYLPEDDDPFITSDYSAAVAYLNERAASYEDDPDGNYEVTYGCASSGNYAAVMVKDLDREHDLGRYIGIELCEDEEEDESTYSIVRHRFNAESEVIETGLSLEDAQAHCQREDTHGEGWFDGYREE